MLTSFVCLVSEEQNGLAVLDKAHDMEEEWLNHAYVNLTQFNIPHEAYGQVTRHRERQLILTGRLPRIVLQVGNCCVRATNESGALGDLDTIYVMVFFDEAKVSTIPFSQTTTAMLWTSSNSPISA